MWERLLSFFLSFEWGYVSICVEASVRERNPGTKIDNGPFTKRP